MTERPLPGLPRVAAAADRAGEAAITRYAPERVVVRAHARRPSLLVLGDTYFAGLAATVDGHDAPIHRVDDFPRGAIVPAGAHTVEFRYGPRPSSGAVVSLLTLLALVATAVVGLRAGRARRSRPGRAAPAG